MVYVAFESVCVCLISMKKEEQKHFSFTRPNRPANGVFVVATAETA